MAKIRILHLSDLHERREYPGMPESRRGLIDLDRNERGIVLGPRFTEALSRLARPIDIVAFTGDVADWGKVSEYEAATARLDAILREVDVPRTRFFAVPGNHDVDRGVHPDAWRKLREWSDAHHDHQPLGRWFRDAASAPDGLPPESRDLVLKRTEAFWNWQRCFRGDKDDLRGEHRLGYRAVVTLGDARTIHIIGLDSAWLCGDKGDQGHILLTQEQLLAHIRDGSEGLDGYRIALVHHPLDHLADQHAVRRLLSDGGVDLLLHGHQHHATALSIDEAGLVARVLASRCLMEGDFGRQWKNWFNLIEIEPLSGSCVVHFRRWAPGGNFWTIGNDLYRNAPDGALSLPPLTPQTAVDRASAGDVDMVRLESLYPVIIPRAELVERTLELRRLDDWLGRRNTDLAVVRGHAGAGKTTLLHQWLAQPKPGYAKRVCRASSRHGTHQLPQFLREVARAIASVTGDPVPITGSAAEFWLRISEIAPSFPADAPTILVLDGIDELRAVESTVDPENFLFELSRVRWPESLRLVVTVRWVPDCFNAGTVIDVGPLAPDRTVAILRMPTNASPGMTQAQAAEVIRVTATDALLVALFRAAYLRDPDPSTWRPANLTPREMRLPDLLRWWRDEQLRREGRLDEVERRDLVAVLDLVACAYGPVTARELAEVSSLAVERIEMLIARGASYLTIGNAHEGYSLAHPLMSRMFDSRRPVNPWLTYVIAALDRLSEPRAYILRHAAAHLCSADDGGRLALLVTPEWRTAQMRATHAPTSFVNDMQLISEWAATRASMGDRSAAELSLRCAVALASTRPSWLPVSAIVELVRAGTWDAAVALSTIQRVVPKNDLAGALSQVLLHDTADLAVDAALARAIALGSALPELPDRVRNRIASGGAPRTHAAVRAQLLEQIGRELPRRPDVDLAVHVLEPHERHRVADGYLSCMVDARYSASRARIARQGAALSPRSSGGRTDEPLLVRLLEYSAILLGVPLADEEQRRRLRGHVLEWRAAIEHPELAAEAEAVCATIASGSEAAAHAVRACALAREVSWGMTSVFVIRTILPLLTDPQVSSAARSLREIEGATERCLVHTGLLHCEATGLSAIESEQLRLLSELTDPFVLTMIAMAPAWYLEKHCESVASRISEIKSDADRLRGMTYLHDRLEDAGATPPAALRSDAAFVLSRAKVGWDVTRTEFLAEACPGVLRLMAYTHRRDWRMTLGMELEALVDAARLLPASERTAAIADVVNRESVHDYAAALERLRLAIMPPGDVRPSSPEAARSSMGSWPLLRVRIDELLAAGNVSLAWSLCTRDQMAPPDIVRRLASRTPPDVLAVMLEGMLVGVTEGAVDGADAVGVTRTFQTEAASNAQAFELWRVAAALSGVWWPTERAAEGLVSRIMDAALASTAPRVRLPFLAALRVPWWVALRHEDELLRLCQAAYEEIEGMFLEASTSAGEWFLARTLGCIDMTQLKETGSPDRIAAMGRALDAVRRCSGELAEHNPCPHCRAQYMGPTCWTLPIARWSDEMVEHFFGIDVEYVREIVLDGIKVRLDTSSTALRLTTMLRALRVARRAPMLDMLLCIRPFVAAYAADLSDDQRRSLVRALERACDEFAPRLGPWHTISL